MRKQVDRWPELTCTAQPLLPGVCGGAHGRVGAAGAGGQGQHPRVRVRGVDVVVPGLSFFASKVKLGPGGVEEFLPLGQLSDYETKALEDLKPVLSGNIKNGIQFASGVPA